MWIIINNNIFINFSLHLIPGREGKLGFLLHYSPKFYNHDFLFVGLTTLGTVVVLWLVGKKLSVQMIQSLIVIYKRGSFVFVGYVHLLLGQCLIPLDPCQLIHLSSNIPSPPPFLLPPPTYNRCFYKTMNLAKGNY